VKAISLGKKLCSKSLWDPILRSIILHYFCVIIFWTKKGAYTQNSFSECRNFYYVQDNTEWRTQLNLLPYTPFLYPILCSSIIQSFRHHFYQYFETYTLILMILKCSEWIFKLWWSEKLWQWEREWKNQADTFHKSRDSSVGIVLGYGLEDWGSRVWFPVVAGNFSFHYHVQNGSGAHPASYPMGNRGSLPGGKAAGAWSWPLISI
jgi:hypothetical protein